MSKYSSFKSHQLITENWRKFLSKAPASSENKDKEKPPPPSSVVSALMKRAGLSREDAEKQAKKQIDLEEAMKSSPEEAAAAAEQIQSSPEGQQALEVAAQDPKVQAALERAAEELQQGALQEIDDPGQEEREIVGGVVAGGASGAFVTQAVALTAWPELMAAVAELPQLAALLGGGAGAVGGLGLALLVNHLRRAGKIEEGWLEGIKKGAAKIQAKAKEWADPGAADPAEEETSSREPDWEKHQAASSRNVAAARAKRPRVGSRSSYE